MRIRTLSLTILALSACAGGTPAPADSTVSAPPAPAAAIDWAPIDSILGRTGAMQPGDVRRYGMPRGDLKVTAGGVQVRPSFALGSWIAFKAHGTGAVAIHAHRGVKYDVIIIGGGHNGLTAAAYLARAGRRVLCRSTAGEPQVRRSSIPTWR